MDQVKFVVFLSFSPLDRIRFEKRTTVLIQGKLLSHWMFLHGGGRFVLNAFIDVRFAALNEDGARICG